jgi:hypothetical protein
LQIGRLSREAGTIIDDFYRQFSFGVIELHEAAGMKEEL